MTRPRLLDLFCGAGGCSVGYARAGFDVVGVDNRPQPRYPYEFHLADAMTFPLDGFDVVHASPPCQQYSRTRNLAKAQNHDTHAPDLLAPTLDRLRAWGGMWVVENVPGAILDGVTLCGRAYGLAVKRHRIFASSVLLMSAGCVCGNSTPVGVYGRPGDHVPQGGTTAKDLAEGQQAMGIDWMPWRSLVEAIPPAFTQHVGEQLMAHLEVAV